MFFFLKIQVPRFLFHILYWFLGLMPVHSLANHPPAFIAADPFHTSSREEALQYLNSIGEVTTSAYWPGIKPALFIQNLRSNVDEPISLYQGSGTNFCGYGAVTYLFLKEDPLGYARLIMQLYREGKGRLGSSEFSPSEAVRQVAGKLRYKGILDIHPADQLWFLTLADHYKGYLNFFNRKYDPGDENRFWASVNYAKFNRMIRSLMNYRVTARGADLVRPRLEDSYGHIVRNMEKGPVVLFINNRIVHKKKHDRIKFAVPTHFIVVQEISLSNGIITLLYWDYGGRTQIQLSPEFLDRIIFGITCCSKK